MYTFINRIRNFIWLKSLAYIIFGLFFLFDPHGTLNIVISLIASFFLVFGVINLISAWRQRVNNEVTDYSMAIGIAQIVIAIIVFILAVPLLSYRLSWESC